MDGSPRETRPKDRFFDPARKPVTECSRTLVRDVLERVSTAERRVRRRRAEDQLRYEAAVTALVCDLAHRHLIDPDARLMVELSKSRLSATRRRAAFMTEQFPEWVKALSAPSLGIADLRLGHYTPFGGERSTIRAGRWMADRIAALGFSMRDLARDLASNGPVIVLRGSKVAGKAKTLDVPDTEEVRRMQAEMDEINAWIHDADLAWYGDGEVDLNDRYLKRIFNNASLALGGRLYGGFWQALGSAARLNHIRIDDRPVVSIDFGQVGVRMAYGSVGIEPPRGDLYIVPGTGGSREGVKKVLNALLATEAVPRRFPAGTKSLFPSGRKFADILEAIQRYHAPIVPLFGSAQALTHQHLESRVIVDVLLHLKTMGIVALPIHDCLLVEVDHRSTAQQAMERSFECFTGVRGATTVEYPTALEHLRNAVENLG